MDYNQRKQEIIIGMQQRQQQIQAYVNESNRLSALNEQDKGRIFLLDELIKAQETTPLKE